VAVCPEADDEIKSTGTCASTFSSGPGGRSSTTLFRGAHHSSANRSCLSVRTRNRNQKQSQRYACCVQAPISLEERNAIAQDRSRKSEAVTAAKNPHPNFPQNRLTVTAWSHPHTS
jgi:hypothetical protein